MRIIMQFSCSRQPASLLATRDGFRCGRSCGVGIWSPVTSVLSGAAVGSCLFFIFALAMLQSPESKYFCQKTKYTQIQKPGFLILQGSFMSIQIKKKKILPRPLSTHLNSEHQLHTQLTLYRYHETHTVHKHRFGTHFQRALPSRN